jgi:hypothetical protein
MLLPQRIVKRMSGYSPCAIRSSASCEYLVRFHQVAKSLPRIYVSHITSSPPIDIIHPKFGDAHRIKINHTIH